MIRRKDPDPYLLHLLCAGKNFSKQSLQGNKVLTGLLAWGLSLLPCSKA